MRSELWSKESSVLDSEFRRLHREDAWEDKGATKAPAVCQRKVPQVRSVPEINSTGSLECFHRTLQHLKLLNSPSVEQAPILLLSLLLAPNCKQSLVYLLLLLFSRIFIQIL